MRKRLLMLLTAAVIFLCGCGKNVYSRVADGAPIKPVHMVGEETEIYLTDYVPLLVANGNVPEKMVVTGNALQTIKFGKAHVVVLPAKPLKLGMAAERFRGNTCIVRASFVSGKVVATVQNHLAPVVDNGDGTWTVTIAPQLEGRSYLRVFAEDDENVYNDLLIPLQDGKPVTNASQLTRHDDEAQVLYSLMVDRFANGNPDNDWKMNNPEVLDIVDYQGGDVSGITA